MILHELEWGNQALRNSNINARFRLVKTQSTNYEELASWWSSQNVAW